MKPFKSCLIITLVWGLAACQVPDNVALTDFTKELISLYIDDPENLDTKSRRDEIIVVSSSDSSHSCVSVFANNPREHNFCRDDNIGQTTINNHNVRVFGDEDTTFYSVIGKSLKPKRCKQAHTEFDPSVWRVCLHRDLSFCKMRSYKVTTEGNIEPMRALVEKHFGAHALPVCSDNEIYGVGEVEVAPRFPLGEEGLQDLLASEFKITTNYFQGKVAVVVALVVDKNGRAALKGITKSSDNEDIDDDALRVAGIVSGYEFEPATHRGERVNAIFPVMFFAR